MVRIFLIVAGLAALAACEVEISKPNEATVRALAERMVYSKDERSGECFGTVSSHPWGNTSDSSMTVTWVPCTEKILALVGK
jgi:hypothetical protein